jgi:hypothetical protein
MQQGGGTETELGAGGDPTCHVNAACVVVYYLACQHTPRMVHVWMLHDAVLAGMCHEAPQARTGRRWWVSAGAQGRF